jgi:putative transposase
MCRYLYNWSLEERITAYEADGPSVSYYDQQNKLPELKKDRPWFKSVHSQVLQSTLKRLDTAYQNFFRRAKAKESPGFPKFKKKGQWNSILYPQYRTTPGPITIVPKVGKVKTVFHRPLPDNANIKTLSILKQAGKWFACFSFEAPLIIELKQESLPSVGIDMGLIDFFYTSDGDHRPVPKLFRRKETQLKRLQKRLSVAPKRSVKSAKILKAIQKVHYRIQCQRSDYLHKEANDLLSKYSIVCCEKLNIKNMIKRPKAKLVNSEYVPNGACRKSGLNKSIADVGWGKFFEFLKYKSISLSKTVVFVNPAYTSQTCSNCGQIVKKALSTRTHSCDCGYSVPRDLNAALNILRLGMETLAAKQAAKKPLLNL